MMDPLIPTFIKLINDNSHYNDVHLKSASGT